MLYVIMLAKLELKRGPGRPMSSRDPISVDTTSAV
jgi:hypothetical protein